jgi:hypothetical protein
VPVYVDEPIFERWGRRWCHLTADTVDELHAFAAVLGIDRSRFQAKPGRPWADHYDIPEERRAEVVALGAVEITLREAGRRLAAKKRRARGEPDSEA